MFWKQSADSLLDLGVTGVEARLAHPSRGAKPSEGSLFFGGRSGLFRSLGMTGGMRAREDRRGSRSGLEGGAGRDGGVCGLTLFAHFDEQIKNTKKEKNPGVEEVRSEP